MDITRYLSSDEAKKGLAKRVSSELAIFQENGSPVLFLFSGGSALSVLDMIDPRCLGSFLTMAPVDERYDPSGFSSNFATFLKTDFFRKAEMTGTYFIDTRVEPGQGRDELVDVFEHALRKWVTEHVSSVIASPPKADKLREESRPCHHGKVIVLLGMGPDGHTAGIFPGDDEKIFHDRFESDRWVVGYRGPEYAACPERITVTPTFLTHHVDETFVFLSGEEKRAAWERVLRDDEPIHSLPAGMFHKLRKAEIFTDVKP
jgi:6-phosphogluconolactonase/glucosamine-6-phosphate isomerase/deaminase